MLQAGLCTKLGLRCQCCCACCCCCCRLSLDDIRPRFKGLASAPAAAADAFCWLDAGRDGKISQDDMQVTLDAVLHVLRVLYLWLLLPQCLLPCRGWQGLAG
jgi:hypothetical protein